MSGERGPRVVEMSDIVLGRILGAAPVEKDHHLLFERLAIVSLRDDVVLMKTWQKK
jgi:hypothetical protein